MNTVILLLNFMSVFMLLNTSKEAILHNNLLEKLIKNNALKVKIIGLIVVLLSFTTSALTYGITTGILINLTLLLLTLSILILFNPIKEANYKFLILLFIISITIEFLTS
ncbi:hypothetical protein [Tenacibaculum halocynthiae]|uniref:hypothetical protein n=1 Tax=Tenacibaculum halocynthiae TaxID=1254437 RepID=UPI003D64CEE8